MIPAAAPHGAAAASPPAERPGPGPGTAPWAGAQHGRRAAGKAGAGFTLIEMMVVLLVMGMAMSLMFGYGDNLLPKTRLAASARDVARALEKVRLHAVLSQREAVFSYDLDNQQWQAYYPQELDEEGEPLGPGRTPLLDPASPRESILMARVVLADGTVRDDGEVTFPVSALGRVAPHDVVVLNPDFPEVEVRTVRVDGLRNLSAILEGTPPPQVLDDAELR